MATTPSAKVDIFNGADISNLYTWINGQGYTDPDNVFTVVNSELRVSGQGEGYIAHSTEWENFVMILEFRWGTTTWAPRVTKARDGGLLVHGNGADGGGQGGKAMSAFQYQIIEGATAGLIIVQGNDEFDVPIAQSIDAKVESVSCSYNSGLNWNCWYDWPGNPSMYTPGETLRYDEAGSNTNLTNWDIVQASSWDPVWEDVKGRTGNLENAVGQWNQVYIIANGTTLTFYLNGDKVNEVTAVSPASGKVHLQTEYAEMFVRKWELWPVGSAPTASNPVEGMVSDFKVQAFSGEIAAGQTVKSLSSPGDFISVADVTKTLLRIPATHSTGAGPTAGTTSSISFENFTLKASLDSGSGITLTRDSTLGTAFTRLQLIEYIGASGGVNEIVVHPFTATLTAVATVDSATIGTITDITKCVPFISVSQSSNNTGNFRRVACTAEMIAGPKVRITRGEAADNVLIQGYVVEFKGSNWTVQDVAAHTITASATTQTKTISAVTLANSFVISSFRFNAQNNTFADYHCWFGSTTTVNYWVSTQATSICKAYVVSNAGMTVQHLDSITGGGTKRTASGSAPETFDVAVTAVADLSQSFLIGTAGSETANFEPPAQVWGHYLTSTTNARFQRQRVSGNTNWTLQVVQLPTTVGAILSSGNPLDGAFGQFGAM